MRCGGVGVAGADPGILQEGGGSGSSKRQVRRNFQTNKQKKTLG